MVGDPWPDPPPGPGVVVRVRAPDLPTQSGLRLRSGSEDGRRVTSELCPGRCSLSLLCPSFRPSPAAGGASGEIWGGGREGRGGGVGAELASARRAARWEKMWRQAPHEARHVAAGRECWAGRRVYGGAEGRACARSIGSLRLLPRCRRVLQRPRRDYGLSCSGQAHCSPSGTRYRASVERAAPSAR